MPQEKKAYQEKLQQVEQETDKAKQVKALIEVMDVRRQDLASVLGWFGCTDLKQKFEAGWSLRKLTATANASNSAEK